MDAILRFGVTLAAEFDDQGPNLLLFWGFFKDPELAPATLTTKYLINTMAEHTGLTTLL